MSPLSLGSAPKIARAVSVRPAPMRPEKPRISPLCSSKLTSWTILPALRCSTRSTTGASGGTALHALWARRHGTKYNGAPYIVQRAGEAVYSEAGKAQLQRQVAYYMNNAHYILNGLKEAGYTVSGGVNAPYIWLKAPNGMTSWQFFDYLLEQANVVGTPGSGFGPSGETYFRLTAFGSYENTVEAIERIKKL